MDIIPLEDDYIRTIKLDVHLILDDIRKFYLLVNDDEIDIFCKIGQTYDPILANKLKKTITADKPYLRTQKLLYDTYQILIDIMNSLERLNAVNRIKFGGLISQEIDLTLQNETQSITENLNELVTELLSFKPYLWSFLDGYGIYMASKNLLNGYKLKALICKIENKSLINKEDIIGIIPNYKRLNKRLKKLFPNNWILTSKKWYFSFFDELIDALQNIQLLDDDMNNDNNITSLNSKTKRWKRWTHKSKPIYI